MTESRELFGFRLPPAAYQDERGVWRNHHGRPYVLLPDGSGISPYQRASKFGGSLEDTSNITLWKQRLTAIGITENKHLQLSIAAAGDRETREGKKALNRVVEDAMKAAGAGNKAEIGTALHALTEQMDRSELGGFVPDEYAADLSAYQEATDCFEWLEIEQFVVQDELRAAGTPDRIGCLTREMTFDNGVTLPAGWVGVVDLKTGGVGFPHGFSVQLSIYANGKGYDPATGERRDLPPVDTDWAILVHLPEGQGECELHLLDIKRGWRAAHIALEVASWRGQKNLTSNLKEQIA